MLDEEFNKLLDSIPTKQISKKISASLQLQNKLHTLKRTNRQKRFPHTNNIFRIKKQIRESKLNHIFNANGNKESIDSLLKGENSETWSNRLANELG